MRALRSGRSLVLLGVALVLGAATANAGPQPTPKPAGKPAEKPADKPADKSSQTPCAPAPTPLPPARFEPTVSRVAGNLAVGLPALEGRVVVALAPLEADATVSRGDELALRVTSLLAGKRSFEAPDHVEDFEAAMNRTRKATAVVYVRVRLDKGRLLATADVHPVPATVWDRVRNPLPGSIAHVFAEAPIDAEVRSFLPATPLVAKLELARGRALESDVLAATCDNLDRDGEPEIVTVSTDLVVLARLRAGKVEAVASRKWADLSGMDPTPLREPIASVFAISPGPSAGSEPLHVVVSSTDRSKSVELDPTLEIARVFPSFAIPEGGAYACTHLQALSITGPLQRCAEGTPEPTRASVTGQFDAYASARLVDATGQSFDVWAGREGGVVEVRDSTGAVTKIPTGGAQLAVGDIDLDGKPEILTSLDVTLGTPDAVVVYTWDRSLKLPPKEQQRIPIASGVRAIALCPSAGARQPIVVATTDEIVVAR